MSNTRSTACVLLCAFVAACGLPAYQQLGGPTMGTQYRVQANCPESLDRSLVAAELARVNAEMSTYDPDSALSRFNRFPIGGPFEAPAGLLEVVAAANELSALSGGRFDVTVGPLVNLWGFGPGTIPMTTGEIHREADQLPTDDEIAAALKHVGYRSLSVDAASLTKSANVYLDLSAIAKGYGVDRVAMLLETLDCTDFLVEIGGEVRARGVSVNGDAWRIGIQIPMEDHRTSADRILMLRDRSAATSGDYRSFFVVDGKRYSHTIDPITGRPVDHSMASVTVVHPSAMWADGYATLLNVLGADAGMAFAAEHDLAVLMIARNGGDLVERVSSAMRAHLVETSQ